MSIPLCNLCNTENSVAPKGKAYCKVCRKNYRDSNKDRIKNYLDNYREKNRNNNVEYQRKYREKNNEELLRKKRIKYLKENPESGIKSKYGEISKHPDYGIWLHMRSRCFNKNHKNYEYYGGRGITVCDRWKDSFDNFMDDMGPRPEPRSSYSIDRYPNKDGNYEPDNCRWATSIQQNNNRRPRYIGSYGMPDHTLIIYNGGITTLRHFSNVTGIHIVVVKYRYSQNTDAGWILHNDFDNRYYEYKGHMYNIKELSLMARVTYEVMYSRIIKLKWPVERAVSET